MTGRITQTARKLMKPAVLGVVDRLNSSEVRRCALYSSHLGAVQLFARSSPDAWDVLRFYKYHLAVLGPYFAGKLSEASESKRLATQCDQAFVDAVHGILERVSDTEEAKRINKAVHDFEHSQRLT